MVKQKLCRKGWQLNKKYYGFFRAKMCIMQIEELNASESQSIYVSVGQMVSAFNVCSV